MMAMMGIIGEVYEAHACVNMPTKKGTARAK